MISWVYGSYLGAFIILMSYLLIEVHALGREKKDAKCD